MSELVHGVDVVEVSRIAALLNEHDQRFAERVFTDAERRYSDASVGGRAERYAARFAAKEAVFKALGCGWSGGTSWTDIGVEHQPGGAPIVALTGRTAELAKVNHIVDWQLSLTHAGGIAMASVIGRRRREES
ncbi:MAG: holo-ACP synthase [Phycisphaerales bacterium]|nr:holo-ACP synthase [Phycisphaerales bacterium]